MLKVVGVVLLTCGVGVSSAYAEFYVCGDASTFTQAFYRDPSPQFPKPPTCTMIPQAEVQQQLDVIASVQPPTLNPARYDYLKVPDGGTPAGRVVEKTPEEKAAVDQAIADAAAAAQALAQERATNVFCNQQNVDAGTTAIAARKDALYAKIDQIQAVNVSTMKAGLKQVVDELATVSTLTVNCFTGRKSGP